MKQLVTLFFFVSLSISSFAQSINLYNIDYSNFPKLKAKYAAFDYNGNNVKPQLSELKLTENGIDRQITGLSCPDAKPPRSLSSVLVLDVSGSMSWMDRQGTQRIDMAKTAAKSWVRALPLVNTECAIVTFDNNSFLNRDYTTDTVKLMSAIDGIAPQGGTNYMSALLLPVASGLEVTKLAKYQKLIIFITDGMPNFEPDVTQIIAEAKRQGCIIVGVTLNMPAPQCIKDITKATGGDYYENITTLQEAQAVYNTIMQKSLGTDFCDIEWESGVYCSPENVEVDLQWNGQSGKASYTVPTSSVVELKVNPSYTNFNTVEANVAHDSIVTLTAVNSDITVNDIKVKYGGSEFTIENVTYPFTIPKGQSKDITLRCLPLDSNLYYNSFEVVTDKCNADFSTSCGEPGRQMPRPTLVLTKPDNTDKLIQGGDIEIAWKGISKKDTVSLFYSTNKGANWNLITSEASNLKYTWTNIPKLQGSNLEFKVEQSSIVNSTIDFSFKAGNLIYTSIISPIGDIIAVGNNQSDIGLYNTSNGQLIKKLSGHKNAIHLVSFSPNGRLLASAGMAGDVGVWDVYSGQKIEMLEYTSGSVFGISFNNAGDKIVFCGADRYAKIWDINGKFLKQYNLPNSTFYYAKFSPDDKTIALAGLGQQVVLMDAATGRIIYQVSLPYDATCVNFNATGTEIIISTESNELYIVNLITKDRRTFPKLHTNKVKSFVYSRDNSMAASASEDGTAIVWNMFTLQMIKTIKHPGLVHSVSFSPDGATLVSSDYTGLVKVTSIKASSLQSDVSDNTLDILRPIASSKNIDMKQCLVGGSSEIMVSDFVKNTGSYKFAVDTIYFTGADASAFQLVSNFRPYTLEPTDGQGTEFRFKANRIGKHTSNIVVVTQADTLVQSIEGFGVAPQLKVINDIVNFGVIDLGENKELKDVPTLANVGSAPIIISNIKVQNVNTKEFENLSASGQITIKPGDTLKLNLKYNPMQDGRTSGRLIFSHNTAGSQEIVQLFGTANLPVAEKFDVDFGIVDISATRDLIAVLLKNKGKADIILRGAKIEGANATDFILGNIQFPITIKPSGEAKLMLTYAPKFVGNSTATLVVNHNGADGIANIALTGSAEKNGIIRYDIDFGNVELNTPKDISAVVLRNDGSKDMTITNASLSDNAFTLLNSQFPLTIAPNGEAKLDLRFTPTQVGKVNANLVLTHNSVNGSSIIRLTATGIETTNQIYDNPIILIKSMKPNPAIDFIEIYYGFNSLEKADVKITSTLGKVVFTGNLEKTDNGYLKIDTRSFGVGHYYITFTSENVVKTEMITIVR